MNIYPAIHRQQRGSALIVALSILLILTILGVASMRTVTLEEKMAGNMRDSQLAFEAAEAALRDAENYINNTPGLADFSATGGIGGYYTAKGAGAEAWTVEANWTTAHPVATYTANGQVSRSPTYIIQVVDSFLGVGSNPNTGAGYGGPPIKSVDVFQVTARGFGVSPNSRAMLQTYVGRI